MKRASTWHRPTTPRYIENLTLPTGGISPRTMAYVEWRIRDEALKALRENRRLVPRFAVVVEHDFHEAMTIRRVA